ncbi:hypothetical protein GCM10023155_23990 [Bremerella cremea]
MQRLLAALGATMVDWKTNRGNWWIALGLTGIVGCTSGPGSWKQAYHEPVAPPEVSAAAKLPAQVAQPVPEAELVSHDQHHSVIESTSLIPTAILPPQNELIDGPIFNIAQAPTPPRVPTSAEPGVTLQYMQDLALANNPTIRQSSASALAASDYQYQVGLSANPIVGYQASQLADANTDQHVVSVEREFVTAHKLGLNQNVLGHAAEAQRWDVESQRYRVMTDVRLAFVDALVAQRRIDVIEDFQTVVAKGADLAKKRFEAREASQSDQLQAEIQLNEVEVLRQQADIAWEAAWQEMAATAGVPDMDRARLDGELSPDSANMNWENIYSTLLGSSPELRASYSRVNQARANMSRQEVQAIPNVTAQLQAGHDNGTGSGMVNLSVGAPIPVFNDNSGNISAAYREYCRATHDVKRIEMSLKARLAGVSKEYDSALVAVKRYEQQILPKAKQTLDLAEQAYTAGEFSFIQVLIVRRTYFDTNLNYITALGDLAKAHAQIDGLLLTGGLDQPTDFQGGDALRGQTFGQQ